MCIRDRSKRNYSQLRIKIGYCCVFDGDYRSDAAYSSYHLNPSEFAFFLYPYIAPEKFLVQAYLNSHQNVQLAAAQINSDHHSLFQEMSNLGICTDKYQARQICWDSFKLTAEYTTLLTDMTQFLLQTIAHFSRQFD